MIELSLLLSIISLILSFFSLLFFFMKFGINITQEFCERPDVIERKVKLETAYRDQLNEEWRDLIDTYPEKGRLGEEAVDDLFNLGEFASLSTLPSAIIKKILSFTEQMISNFVYIVFSIFGCAASYLVQIVFPFDDPYQNIVMVGTLFILSLFIGVLSARNMKDMIPRIIELRRQFFLLSESANLHELRELSDDLKYKDIL